MSYNLTRPLKVLTYIFLPTIFTLLQLCAAAATTSWIGVTSTSWTTSTNWSFGVPTATTDVVIGDASFTGAFQPSVTSTAALKSLTIGNGTKVSVLSIGSRRNNYCIWKCNHRYKWNGKSYC